MGMELSPLRAQGKNTVANERHNQLPILHTQLMPMPGTRPININSHTNLPLGQLATSKKRRKTKKNMK